MQSCNRNIYLVFIISILQYVTQWTEGLKLPGTDNILTHHDHVTLEFENVIYTSKTRNKRYSDKFPESFSLRLRLEEPIYLVLKRNKNVSPNVPTFRERNGVIEQRQDTRQQIGCAHYQDESFAASMHLECKESPDKRCVFRVLGSFVYNGVLHILEETSTKTDDVSNITYRVSQLLTPLSLGNDYIHIAETSDKPKDHTRRRRAASGNYIVELFLVTDYSVFKFWYDESSSATHQGKTDYAINTIKQYYAFLINGMDIRYAYLPGYRVIINYAGIFIAETESNSLFVESLKSSTTATTVDVNRTLSSFSSWINTNKNSLPVHDHAMLFTKYDFTLYASRSVTGLAYTSAMCTGESQSVVEDTFNFLTQTIAAHELAHSLGAVHDGDDNGCSKTTKYIMSTIVSATQGADAYHPWQFSTCSENEMSSHIGSMSNNCMLSQTSSVDPNDLNQYLVTKIGQTFGVDRQCQLSMGDRSFACRSPYNNDYSSVCTGLWCLDVNSNPSECALIIPGDGTTCGDKKWCINGQCVTANEAPTVSSNTCVFGDRSGQYTNGQTCQQIVTTAPWNCYASTFRVDCCQSCSTVYDATKTDCQYGDRSGDCVTAITTGFPCYDSSNERSCCRTCAKFQTTISGCKYGDKATNCVRQSCVLYGQRDFTNCCESCYNISTTPNSLTTTPSSGSGTTTSPPQALPTWVIPTAAGGGGLLLLIIIIIIGCCACRNKSGPEDKLAKSNNRNNFSNVNQPYPGGRPYTGAYKQPQPYVQPNRAGNYRQPTAYPQSQKYQNDRGPSVKSNARSENIYTEIEPSGGYQPLQSRQGMEHQYSSTGQYQRGQNYSNKAYSHPRY